MSEPEDPRPSTDDGGDARLRLALSSAVHHRRRRRVALLLLSIALAAFAAVVAASTGSSGAWDPMRMREGVVTELPKLKLEAQARAAAAALARRKRVHTIEGRAVSRVLERNPFIRRAGSQSREIALTFDDGPSPYTQRILDALARGGAKATFFTLGSQLGEFPLPLQRAVAEGHEIGDHTWNHADLTKLPRPQVAAEIREQARGLQRAGIPRPRLFRPPYMAFDGRTLKAAARAKMLTVLWTVDSGDYEARDPRVLARQVLAEARPGAIVLMHDGGGNRTVTGRALPSIVRGLRRRGYRMVTVSQLLLDNPPGPGLQQEPVGRSEVP